MKKLKPQEQHYFDISMTWSEQFWDDQMSLLRASNDNDNKSKQSSSHTVRNTIWYALGLLQQAQDERAHKAIRAVLRYQYDTPDKIYHGTFKRTPIEPDPPEKNEIWKDYDPNWREFIGSVFLIMLRDFDLPEALQAEMWTAIQKAAEGAYTRNIDPAYSNIALMSALLLDHAGKHFGKTEWRERAEGLAHHIYALFEPNACFWEYNSPTYYGVDLYALSLWRDYGLTESFTSLGTKMEAALWQDIALFYHADLKNLCGPYDRSYGMDLTQYAGLVGLYIALVVPTEKAPLPDASKAFDHEHDYMFGPLAAYLGTQVPEDVLPHLSSFQGARQLERSIEANRVATAFLTEGLMLGGETLHPSRLPNEQFHAATVHWQLQDGSVAWMRLRCDEPVSVKVDGNTMTLNCEAEREILFEVNAGSLNSSMINKNSWSLANLKVEHSLTTTVTLTEASELAFKVPAGEFSLVMTVENSVNYTALK